MIADRETPAERGEVRLQGRCQVCGNEGPVFAVPSAPPPNEMCERCAIEYGEAVEEDGREDEE